MMKKIMTTAALMCAIAAVAGETSGASGRETVFLLQIGSDWCVSGNDVKETFESAEFRNSAARLCGSGENFRFEIYDDMDAPNEAAKAANAKVARFRVETKRFPAITCVSGPKPLDPATAKFFAAIENIPCDISPDGLAGKISAAVKGRDRVEELLAKASSANAGGASKLYSEAFDELFAMAGDMNAKSVKSGALSWEKEWKAFEAADKAEGAGWLRRHTLGTGIDLVEKASSFRKKGDFKGGEEFIRSLQSPSLAPLTPVQRQSIDMAAYALWRTSPERAESNKSLLKGILERGRDSVWGQAALGYLILAGEKFEMRPRYRAPVRARPAPAGAAAGVPCGSCAGDLAVAREAVMRRVGRDGLDALAARPGAAAFIDSFFNDSAWMEDFVWSGPGADGKALLALESIVFQDGGRWEKTVRATVDRWIPGAGKTSFRNFATALALECKNRDEAWLADYADAYRTTASRGRLHASAYLQGVWRWRFAIQQSHEQAHSDDPANQQRFLDGFVNRPAREYGKSHWFVPYRSYNCFGESVHGPHYYEPWHKAGEFAQRTYSWIVGGVCGELSKFGSACSNAHGLPSTTCGQPYHCAYARRLPDGKWTIENYVDAPTSMHLCFWPESRGEFSYVEAYEGMFEGDRGRRMAAARSLERAEAARSAGAPADEIRALYDEAVAACPVYYDAQRLYMEWLVSAGAGVEELEKRADEAASALRGWRAPLWRILDPVFDASFRKGGCERLAGELVRFADSLRESSNKLAEESDFRKILNKWAKPLEENPDEFLRVFSAMLDSQRDTRSFFPAVLAWGADAMLARQDGSEKFIAVLERFSSKNGEKAALDFAPLVLSASRTSNLPAFRKFNELAAKLAPSKRQTDGSYKTGDFGGELLSAGGMLRTSSSSVRYDRPLDYVRCIDASEVEVCAFHTDDGREHWAEVVLPGMADVTGVLVENRRNSCKQRQVPLEVLVSEDGKTWEKIYGTDEVRDVWRVDISGSRKRARYVRVVRKPQQSGSEPFHLAKILVYGVKLY